MPLVLKTYGNWGVEALETFSRLASLLAASHSVPKSKAAADIIGCLDLTLTRSVARTRIQYWSPVNSIVVIFLPIALNWSASSDSSKSFTVPTTVHAYICVRVTELRS